MIFLIWHDPKISTDQTLLVLFDLIHISDFVILKHKNMTWLFVIYCTSIDFLWRLSSNIELWEWKPGHAAVMALSFSVLPGNTCTLGQPPLAHMQLRPSTDQQKFCQLAPPFSVSVHRQQKVIHWWCLLTCYLILWQLIYKGYHMHVIDLMTLMGTCTHDCCPQSGTAVFQVACM